MRMKRIINAVVALTISALCMEGLSINASAEMNANDKKSVFDPLTFDNYTVGDVTVSGTELKDSAGNKIDWINAYSSSEDSEVFENFSIKNDEIKTENKYITGTAKTNNSSYSDFYHTGAIVVGGRNENPNNDNNTNKKTFIAEIDVKFHDDTRVMLCDQTNDNLRDGFKDYLNMEYTASTGTATWMGGSFAMTNNEWHHIAASYMVGSEYTNGIGPTDKVRLYVDGTYMGEATASQDVKEMGANAIGLFAFNALAPNSSATVDLDNAAIYYTNEDVENKYSVEGKYLDGTEINYTNLQKATSEMKLIQFNLKTFHNEDNIDISNDTSDITWSVNNADMSIDSKGLLTWSGSGTGTAVIEAKRGSQLMSSRTISFGTSAADSKTNIVTFNNTDAETGNPINPTIKVYNAEKQEITDWKTNGLPASDYYYTASMNNYDSVDYTPFTVKDGDVTIPLTMKAKKYKLTVNTLPYATVNYNNIKYYSDKNGVCVFALQDFVTENYVIVKTGYYNFTGSGIVTGLGGDQTVNTASGFNFRSGVLYSEDFTVPDTETNKEWNKIKEWNVEDATNHSGTQTVIKNEKLCLSIAEKRYSPVKKKLDILKTSGKDGFNISFDIKKTENDGIIYINFGEYGGGANLIGFAIDTDGTLNAYAGGTTSISETDGSITYSGENKETFDEKIESDKDYSVNIKADYTAKAFFIKFGDETKKIMMPEDTPEKIGGLMFAAGKHGTLSFDTFSVKNYTAPTVTNIFSSVFHGKDSNGNQIKNDIATKVKSTIKTNDRKDSIERVTWEYTDGEKNLEASANTTTISGATTIYFYLIIPFEVNQDQIDENLKTTID